MSRLERVVPQVDGCRVLLALGGLYVAVAAVYPFALPVDATVTGEEVVVSLLGGAAGAIVLYVARWLPGSDVHPGAYDVVVRWCLRGIVAMLGLLGLVALASGLRDPVANVVILTAIGCVAGLAAGVHDARATSRRLELEETVARLRTANERLSQFTHAASHDLQEPLRMVSTYLRLLESSRGDDLDEDEQEYLQFAVEGADRMRKMVDSLHEYSRVSPSEAPLERTDADEVLEDVLDDLQLRIEETDATVTSDDLPTVTADEAQLTHLFQNLLSNAIRHSGGEAPRVHVSAERLDASERVEAPAHVDGAGEPRADAQWRFAVADEGPGIPPEYQERLFGAFERFRLADEEHDVDAGGTGLALCERIVERHGGEIWVESEPGEGATFYFTLPDAPTNTAERSGEAQVAE